MEKKYLIILWIILFIGLNSKADAQPCSWSARAGGSEHDNVKALCTDSERNLYVAGTTDSPACYFITDTLYKEGSDDLFIVKYDQSGNEMWIKQLGWYNDLEEEYESIGGIEFDTLNQRLLISGTFYQHLNLKDTTLNGWGLTGFILCMDSDGNEIWARAVVSLEQTSGDVRFLGITYDEFGNIYTSGCNKLPVSFNGIIVPAGGFLAKYDKDGNILWAKNKFRYWSQWPPTAMYPYTEAPPFNIAYSNNSLLVNGYTKNDTIIIDTLSVYYGSSVTSYVAHFTSDGNLSEYSSSAGPRCFSGSQMVVDNEGVTYVTGIFEKSIGIFGYDTLHSQAEYCDCFLSKLDPTGEFIWTMQLFASQEAWGDGLSMDVEGNIYMSGHFRGEIRCGAEIITSGSASDMFLAKFSTEGNCIGFRKYSAGEIPEIQVDNFGNICLAGKFINTLVIGPNIFSSYGFTDIFAAKCSPITGIVQPKAEVSNTLLIYANPNTGQCNVTIPEEFLNEKNLQLQIFDRTGRLIQEARVEMAGDLVKLDISAQAKGLYFAVLSNGKKSYQGKIVFQ